MPIVVVGNVFVDFKGFPEGAYIPAGRNAGRVEIVHGGVGRNVAEDIANVELREVSDDGIGAVLVFIEEVGNARESYLVDILVNFLGSHTDTTVADGQSLFLLVEGDVNAQFS